jgi:hypothetical protein
MLSRLEQRADTLYTLWKFYTFLDYIFLSHELNRIWVFIEC